MTAEKIQEFKTTLVNLRDRLVGEKRQLLDQVQMPVDNASGNDISTSSLRPETVGVSEGDEEVAIGLYDNAAQAHTDIVAALERITKGTFGICDKCGKKIAQERLKAIPYARRCTTCSSL